MLAATQPLSKGQVSGAVGGHLLTSKGAESKKLKLKTKPHGFSLKSDQAKHATGPKTARKVQYKSDTGGFFS